MYFNSVCFGQQLRRLRLEHHFTQEQLAEQIEVGFQFIGLLERGCRVPSVDTILRLCNVLDCTPDVLLQDSLSGQNIYELRSPSILDYAYPLSLTDMVQNQTPPPPGCEYADLDKLPPIKFADLKDKRPLR